MKYHNRIQTYEIQKIQTYEMPEFIQTYEIQTYEIPVKYQKYPEPEIDL